MNGKRKKTYVFVIFCMIMFAIIMGGTLSQTALAEEGEATNTITNSPVITVLVNGENTEKEWTNNEVQQSFVEQLCANGRAEPYILKSSIFSILFELDESAIKKFDYDSHAVIVYKTPYISIESKYNEFKTLINNVSDEYYKEKNMYPKLNLIGSSSGGLVTMKYAIEYPERVDTLLSIGTPYNGSELAQYSSLRNMFKINNIHQEVWAKRIPHEDEYITEVPQKLLTLREQWNNLEQKPKTYAISMGMTNRYLNALANDLIDKAEISRIEKVGAKLILPSILSNLLGSIQNFYGSRVFPKIFQKERKYKNS